MKLSQLFPSKYFKADDFKTPALLTISRISFERLQEGESEQPVMHFLGKDQALVLKKTNAGIIAEFLGDDTDQWIGKKVLITTKLWTIDGKNTRGWIIMPIMDEKSDDFDDEIPF